jgi:hypothetical protein
MLNRRQFIGHATALAGLATAPVLRLHGQPRPSSVSRVAIVIDPSDPMARSRPALWAIQRVRLALEASQIPCRLCERLNETTAEETSFVVSGYETLSRHGLTHASSLPTEPESLAVLPAIAHGRQVLLFTGADARGLVYGLSDFADIIATAGNPGQLLQPTVPVIERASTPVRGVMRLFVSDTEDKSWFNDRGFWTRYLDLLATERFNRFQLAFGLGYDFARDISDSYFNLPYPFLVAVRGYQVRATNLPESERDNNLVMLRFISEETMARGMDFQLGIWSHSYEWPARANHHIEGLSPERHAPYARDALAQILRECPAISGVTLRVHGESGVAEGSHDFWRTVFSAVSGAGRAMRLDLHAKNTDEEMIALALKTGLPVTISPKFWAEHMGLPYHQSSIRPQELAGNEHFVLTVKAAVDRRFTRYSFGDLLKTDREYKVVHRVWPGTQRLLLWGDPLFTARYCRVFRMADTDGCELFEPLSFKGRRGSGRAGGRHGYLDRSLIPSAGDFEKFAYTYRLWGRLLYRPDTDPEVWRRHLRQVCGPAAEEAEAALGNASRILPLITAAFAPSGSVNRYWPELFVPMGIVADLGDDAYPDTPEPKTMVNASSLDPQLFATFREFADALRRGESLPKYTPVDVAHWSEQLAAAAELHLNKARAAAPVGNTAFRRLEIDVDAQIRLSRFFGKLFRVVVLYALYERTGRGEFIDRAIVLYREATLIYAQLADRMNSVYVADITFGNATYQRGHWRERLPALARDLAAMERRPKPLGNEPVPNVPAILETVEKTAPSWPDFDASHRSSSSFARGQPVSIELSCDHDALREVRLHYRVLHQAAAWQAVSMTRAGRDFRARIETAYADTPYPLQYYFSLRGDGRRPQLYPGIGSNLAGEPYWVISPRRKRSDTVRH